MVSLTKEIIHFLQNQSFVIVSTINVQGQVHSACKGIVKIDPSGRVYLLDLYKGRTYKNIRRNSNISITAVDEHKFMGYCLRGKAEILGQDKLDFKIIKAWEKNISNRITSRIIKNIRGEKGHFQHPELLLPKPEYMVVMKVLKVIDLAPHPLIL